MKWISTMQVLWILINMDTYSKPTERINNTWQAVHTYDAFIDNLIITLKKEKYAICRGSYKYILNSIRRERDDMISIAKLFEACAKANTSNTNIKNQDNEKKI